MKIDRIGLFSEKVKTEQNIYFDEFRPKLLVFLGKDGGKYSERSVRQIMANALI